MLLYSIYCLNLAHLGPVDVLSHTCADQCTLMEHQILSGYAAEVNGHKLQQCSSDLQSPSAQDSHLHRFPYDCKVAAQTVDHEPLVMLYGIEDQAFQVPQARSQ